MRKGKGFVQLVLIIASVATLFVTSRRDDWSRGDSASVHTEASRVAAATTSLPVATSGRANGPSTSVRTAGPSSTTLVPPSSSNSTVSSTALAQTSTTVTIDPAAGSSTTERPYSADVGCGGGQDVRDVDGECAASVLPAHAPTVVWWHQTPHHEAACEIGYEIASAESLVPGGLDRATYDSLCATTAVHINAAVPTPDAVAPDDAVP